MEKRLFTKEEMIEFAYAIHISNGTEEAYTREEIEKWLDDFLFGPNKPEKAYTDDLEDIDEKLLGEFIDEI